MEPLVSILINNHNYGRYVGAAIKSALDQTYPSCEVIVVDDGSTDESWDVISAFGGKIIAIRTKNQGQAAAMGTGFACSHGDIVCLLDADDTFLPDKVTRVVSALQNSAAQWCFHHLQWTDGVLDPITMPTNPHETGFYDLREEARKGKFRLVPPATSGLSFSRSLFGAMLPIPKGASDNYLKFMALSLAGGYYLKDQLSLQRVHSASWYTNNRDPLVKLNLQLITALGLRRRLPALGPVWNRMYADALGVKLGSRWKPLEDLRESLPFLRMLSPKEALALCMRVTYKAAGVRMRKIKQGAA